MSIKKLLGLCTRRLSLWVLASASAVGCRISTGILSNYGVEKKMKLWGVRGEGNMGKGDFVSTNTDDRHEYSKKARQTTNT